METSSTLPNWQVSTLRRITFGPGRVDHLRGVGARGLGGLRIVQKGRDTIQKIGKVDLRLWASRRISPPGPPISGFALAFSLGTGATVRRPYRPETAPTPHQAGRTPVGSCGAPIARVQAAPFLHIHPDPFILRAGVLTAGLCRVSADLYAARCTRHRRSSWPGPCFGEDPCSQGNPRYTPDPECPARRTRRPVEFPVRSAPPEVGAGSNEGSGRARAGERRARCAGDGRTHEQPRPRPVAGGDERRSAVGGGRGGVHGRRGPRAGVPD